MLRTPVSALIGQCQVCGTDGSIARMNSVWWNRKEVRYHTACGICSHLFGQGELKPHPFRQTHMSALATDGWWVKRVGWSPVGGADGRGRFLRPVEAENLVEQLRSGVYLAPGVTEEQLAPRRALIFELETHRHGLEGAVRSWAVELGRRFADDLERVREEESQRRRRQAAKAARARRREKPEAAVEVVAPEEPAVPKCVGCYGEITTATAYTDRESADDLFCKSCAKVIYTDLRGAEAVAHRVSLAPEIEEAPSVVIEEAVEIATEPALEPEAPEVIDPEQAAARGEIRCLLENGLIRRRLTEAQLNNVKFLYGQGDFTRALVLLRAMIEASVTWPKPPALAPEALPAGIPDDQVTCRRCGEIIETTAWKIVWQWFGDGNVAVPGELADIFEKYVKGGPQPLCGSCGREARELVVELRKRYGWDSNPYWTHRLEDQPTTPPLERREPLAAGGEIEERVAQPAAATATA